MNKDFITDESMDNFITDEDIENSPLKGIPLMPDTNIETDELFVEYDSMIDIETNQ